MRLHPALTEEEVYRELREDAVRHDGEEGAKALEASLRAMAEAMAAISAHPLPITTAPLFP